MALRGTIAIIAEADPMHELMRLMHDYGLALVFLGVLIESLGVPLPAMLLLIGAGAYAGSDAMFEAEIFVLAVLACLLGEVVWFVAGLRYGSRVLKTLCRISLSPDSCVRQSESFYERWGPKALVAAKFIPALSTVASPIAGAMRMPAASFLRYSALGDAIWVGFCVGVGVIFRAQIEQAESYLSRMGAVAIYLAAILMVAFLAFKWWQRQRFFKSLRMARITTRELQDLFKAGANPVVLDVRSDAARKIDSRKIPGAVFVDLETADTPLADLSPDTEVVVYCTCPSEASAARVARFLMDRGFRRVRPLAGGLDAWYAHGAPT
jgi:membrane protein DedA with SNARE-associated domain/rhodanese-related sulfurtransferase